MIATTRSAVSVSEPTSYVAFELSKKECHTRGLNCSRACRLNR
jgi:hypothetical protein